MPYDKLPMAKVSPSTIIYSILTRSAVAQRKAINWDFVGSQVAIFLCIDYGHSDESTASHMARAKLQSRTRMKIILHCDRSWPEHESGNKCRKRLYMCAMCVCVWWVLAEGVEYEPSPERWWLFFEMRRNKKLKKMVIQSLELFNYFVHRINYLYWMRGSEWRARVSFPFPLASFVHLQIWTISQI